MTYIKLFVDYLDAVAPLGDAERGRLFTALLAYAGTGEVPELSGNERFLFPILRAQVDRDEAEYARFVEKQRSNGAKGGRPRRAGENPDLFSETQRSQDEDKDKEKDINKDVSKDKDEEKDGGGAAVAAVETAYRERVNAAPSGTCLRELEGFARVMGADCCLRAFDIALDAKKPTWTYIRGILSAKQAQGVRSLADWDRAEEAHRRGSAGKRAGSLPKSDIQPAMDRIRKNGDWLERLLAEQAESEARG